MGGGDSFLDQVPIFLSEEPAVDPYLQNKPGWWEKPSEKIERGCNKVDGQAREDESNGRDRRSHDGGWGIQLDLRVMLVAYRIDDSIKEKPKISSMNGSKEKIGNGE